MPLFKKDPNKEFAPTEARFSDIYKYATNSKRVPHTAKKALQDSMTEAGYRKTQINKALNDKELTIDRLKELARGLNEKRVYGFKKSPDGVVDGYIQREVTKRKSINRRISQGRAEAMKEVLTPMDKPISEDKGSGRIPPSMNLKV
jgi:hypothetical protein